jgi:hypothetical protein
MWSGSVLAVMPPIQPISPFGKCQPMSRNFFECLFEAWVAALFSALFGH